MDNWSHQQRRWFKDFIKHDCMNFAIRDMVNGTDSLNLPEGWEERELLTHALNLNWALTDAGYEYTKEHNVRATGATVVALGIAEKVPACDIQKKILRFMNNEGFDTDVNTIAKGDICNKLSIDDEVGKNAIRALRDLDLVKPHGNHPRLKYYLSVEGRRVASYIKLES